SSDLFFKYFANGHTPHSVNLVTISTFLKQNEELLKKNIRYKFRNQKQFNVISLSNHLQLNLGNRHIAKPDLAYIQPVGRSKDYIDKKIAYCKKNKNIKFLCVQSLDLCSQTDRDKLYSWMDRMLEVN
ncbi:MAG: hypothetical protein PHD00_04505, partial [Bacteroidales bacterium]|nr:hypothetical protein [Bacteroidales bacterium]